MRHSRAAPTATTAATSTAVSKRRTSGANRLDTHTADSNSVADSLNESHLWNATPVAANTSRAASNNATRRRHSAPPKTSAFGDLSRTAADLWVYVTSCGFHDSTTTSSFACAGREPLHCTTGASAKRRFPNASPKGKVSVGKRPTMRIKVGESKSKHAMNDDINTSAAATKNDALSTAATEEDDLDLDDGGGAAADIQANGPTIAVCGKAGGDCHLPTFSPAPKTDAAGTTASNKKSTVAKNCYSQPPLSLFSVRGPTYMADQKKIASGPYLLASRGLDLFLTDKQHPVVLDQMTHALLGGQLRSKPTLAINFRFPWGYMNLYFEIPTKLAKYVPRGDGVASSPTVASVAEDTTLTIAERTLALWLLGDTSYKNERLKLIPYVAQGPFLVRNMVTGRPAIIGKKLPVSYQSFACSDDQQQQQQHPLIMTTLDIGNSSATAQRIVSVCRRYMAALTVDIGFVIQGNANEELPEQMMGAMRVHGPDPGQAPTVR